MKNKFNVTAALITNTVCFGLFATSQPEETRTCEIAGQIGNRDCLCINRSLKSIGSARHAHLILRSRRSTFNFK